MMNISCKPLSKPHIMMSLKVKERHTNLCIPLSLGKAMGRRKPECCVSVELIWVSNEESSNLLLPEQHYKRTNLLISASRWRSNVKDLLCRSDLKKDRFPSWVHVSNTGPWARTEKLRYCTVVTGDLRQLLFRWRWVRDNAPVWESIVTEYIHPYLSCPTWLY